jgi:YD repeat-containing protein
VTAPTSPLTLDHVVDDAAFLSYEHQLHLADVAESLGEHRFQVDLDTQVLELTGERTLRTTVHLLGSTAENPGSWLWGWANRSGFSEQVTALGRQAADFGRQYGIAELTEPEQPLTPDIAARLVDAVKIVTGHWTSYSGQAGPGTRVYMLIEAPELALPVASVPRTMRVFGESLGTGMVHDHRRAVASYARLRSLPMTAGPDGSQTQLHLPDGQVTLTFDGAGRIGNMHFTAGPQA